MKNFPFTNQKLIQLCFKWYSKYRLKYGTMLLVLAIFGSYSNKIYGNSNENPQSPQDEIERIMAIDHELVDDIPVVVAPPVDNDAEIIFKAVEEPPVYPGGADELKKYIYDNLKYPENAKEQGIEGRVVIQFVVNKTGKITKTKVVQSLHPSCDKEAIRLIKLMPDWIPGTLKGKNVAVTFTFPVRFKLEKNE